MAKLQIKYLKENWNIKTWNPQKHFERCIWCLACVRCSLREIFPPNILILWRIEKCWRKYKMLCWMKNVIRTALLLIFWWRCGQWSLDNVVPDLSEGFYQYLTINSINISMNKKLMPYLIRTKIWKAKQVWREWLLEFSSFCGQQEDCLLWVEP